MKINRCRKAILSLSLLMFFGFSPFDWLTLITNYFFNQSSAVVQQNTTTDDGSGNVSTPVAPPSAETSGQCPMCPGPRPRPRPIPPVS